MGRGEAGEHLSNTSCNSTRNKQLAFYYMYLFLYSVHIKAIS